MIILLFFYPPFTHYNLHVLLFPLYTIITVTCALRYIDTPTQTHTTTGDKCVQVTGHVRPVLLAILQNLLARQCRH